MTLKEAIETKINGNKKFHRESWTHGDFLIVKGWKGSYGGGELYYDKSGHRATLFYVDDLIADDWVIKNDTEVFK